MKIGIVGAMQIEVDALQASMAQPTTETISGISFVSGTLGKHQVVAAVCGIGKVFAAMCAQTMILRYQPDAVINIGIAGTVTSGLRVLDIAIADQVCQHDMDTSALGDPVGLISGINQIYFPTDPALSRAIAHAAETLGFRHRSGTIASGDLFVHTQEKKTWIHDTFHAIAAEMEGGSIGQICAVNQIPFAVLRTISDGDGGSMDYNTFAQKAALQSIQVIKETLAAL